MPPPPPSPKLGAVSVAVLLFASIAGGPYGIEACVGAVGSAPTLLALLITTVIWASTQALMAVEMATMFPTNAGAVVWVFAGLGLETGWLHAWVFSLANAVNAPLYARVVSASLGQLFPLSRGAAAAVELAAIAVGVAVNVVGVSVVERFAGALALVAQTPFVAMPIVWAAHGQPFQWRALGSSNPNWRAGAPLFISTLLWSTMGISGVGNLVAEVAAPARDIPRGAAAAVALVAATYLWPLLFLVPMQPPLLDNWADGEFVSIASAAARGLGVWTGVCCALACLGTLTSLLALSARSLQCVAAAGLLAPRALAVQVAADATRFRTPVPALCFTAAVSCALLALEFESLVVLELLLACVALALQFAAFLRLKHTARDAPRPCAVPGGVPGAWAVAVPFYVLVGLLVTINATDEQALEESAAVAALVVVLAAGSVLWARTAVLEDVLRKLGGGDDRQKG